MVVRARNERVRKMRDKTIDVLLQMGVPASIKGFTYICDAIEFNFFLISLAGKTRIKPDESIDQGRLYLHDRCNLFFGIIGDTAKDILGLP